MIFSKSKKIILDLFFPIRCQVCGKEGYWLCKICLSQVKLKESQVCHVCKWRKSKLGETCWRCKNTSNLNGVLIVAEPDQQVLRKLVHKFKYNSFKEVGEILGDLFLNKFCHEFKSNEDLTFIPVPLHTKRERRRGFNQSLILSSFLGSYTNLRVLKNTLLRTKNTKPQMKLKRRWRLENLKRAFKVSAKLNPQKTYILVDDIITTGATLEECAKALKQAGANKVWGLVLSRGT